MDKQTPWSWCVKDQFFDIAQLYRKSIDTFDYEEERKKNKLCEFFELFSKNTEKVHYYYIWQIIDYYKEIYGEYPDKSFSKVNFVKALLTLSHTTNYNYKIICCPSGISITKKYSNKNQKQTTTKEITEIISVKNEGDIVIYVYHMLNNIKCLRSSRHECANVTIFTKNLTDEEVSFNAFFCKTCHKYFVTMDIIKKEFPKLKTPLIKLDVSTYFSGYERKEESELTIFGYSVKANGPDDSERQSLLSQLLASQILTKAKIISILTNNINYNGRKQNLQNAVKKWKDDIEFVQNFGVKEQQKVITEKPKFIYRGKPLKE